MKDHKLKVWELLRKLAEDRCLLENNSTYSVHYVYDHNIKT